MQLFNSIGMSYPKNSKLWSVNKQHVCLFAMIVFGDVLSMTTRQNQITDTKATSITIKRYSKLD
jgi:hypothetical protein